MTDLHIIIAVHDTGKDARAKLLYHVFQGFPLSAPGSHDTVLCCWYAHGHWLSIIQVELHNAAYFAQMKHMLSCQPGSTITYQGSHKGSAAQISKHQFASAAQVKADDLTQHLYGLTF